MIFWGHLSKDSIKETLLDDYSPDKFEKSKKDDQGYFIQVMTEGGQKSQKKMTFFMNDSSGGHS